jgi:RNA polymerase sigma-70 factor (ECF subfamily)
MAAGMVDPATSDEDLVAAAQQGDRVALDALLTRYHGRLMRFGARLCSRPDAAEDVAQETMLAVVRSIQDFRGASRFSTWLYTIARRNCLRRFRKSKFAPEREDSLEEQREQGEEPAEANAPSPADRAEAREVDAALARAIAELDPQSREVLVLRDVEGLSAAEVAEVTGTQVPAVKSRLHRARVQVRNALAPVLDRDGMAPETPACRDVVTLFSQHLEGEIDGEICRRMQAHVDGCPRCRMQCDGLKRTLLLCAHQPAEVPPAQRLAVQRALGEFLAGKS